MHIQWTKDYNLGIDVIDMQHRRMVDYINEIDDAIRLTGKDREAKLVRVLTEVVDYTESHFSFEEALLEDIGYPFLNVHKKVHELFIRRINDYILRFGAGEDIIVELHDTLTRWLLTHIRTEDANYAQYLHKKEAAASRRPPGPKPRDAKTASRWKRLLGWGK